MSKNAPLDDARYKHLLALIAQAAGESLPFTVAATFVYRPGGVAYRNVFTTWAALMAAVSLLDPETSKFITVDDSLLPAHATTVNGGAPWNLDNCTFLINNAGNGQLLIDPGCHFAYSSLWLKGGMVFEVSAAATAPVVESAPFACTYLEDGDLTQIIALGAHPFCHVGSTGGMFVSLEDQSILGDATHNVFTVDVGGSLIFSVGGEGIGATINTHAIGGLGTAICGVGSTGMVHSPQDVGTLTIINNALSQNTAFTAGTPGNWAGSAPTQVKAAIDRLAAAVEGLLGHAIP